MAWLLVIVAGLLETGFAVCLKLSHGFTRLWPSARSPWAVSVC
jgi:quaternary ammonium compound-resistance protein SugE